MDSSCFAFQRFPKSQRLSKREDFQQLIHQGKSLFIYPYVCYYWIKENDSPLEIKVAFSVSKKKFKRAIDRNRTKRLMREVYRKNKYQLYSALSEKKVALSMIFVYIETKHLPYSFHEKKTIALINNMIEICKKNKNDKNEKK